MIDGKLDKILFSIYTYDITFVSTIMTTKEAKQIIAKYQALQEGQANRSRRWRKTHPEYEKSLKRREYKRQWRMDRKLRSLIAA